MQKKNPNNSTASENELTYIPKPAGTTSKIVFSDDQDRRAAPRPANRIQRSQVGHYRLLSLLGTGGMGEVYRAEDTRSGQFVAIKLLARHAISDPQAAMRFEKEARLLEEVNHEHITNLIEFGRDADQHYIVMEFVNGFDLRQLIHEVRMLDERVALEMTCDVAHALAAAHERGIVHRDIKPGNILLTFDDFAADSSHVAILEQIRDGRKAITKLSDFGLARHIEQTESLAMTKTGTMLGTPYYLAPEQCSTEAQVGPAADIYALGATLFEMLTGRPPFMASDPVKLISMHCFDLPPSLRKLNPLISDAVEQLVHRMLEKSPQLRFADGAHLAREIESLLNGDASPINAHPLIPPAKAKVLEEKWTWELDSDPDDLWPLVSNTERLNCAIGLPSVEYRTERDAKQHLRVFGSFRLAWATLSWEEHPYEWIEGRKLGVLREFTNGPFQWLLSSVELKPRPAGGTILTHHVRLATRGKLGEFLGFIELKLKGSKGLDAVYRRMDQVLRGKINSDSQILDPFEKTAKLRAAAHRRLEQRAAQLHDSPADPRSVETLLAFLKEAPPQELGRIRPVALARKLGVDPDTLTEVCLQACHCGLLILQWDILCPTCRISSSVKQTLQDIEHHSHCEACDLDFDIDFDSSVEMIFRVHPEIRQAETKTYCIGGPGHSPHVVSQIRLDEKETVELDLVLEAGSYLLRSPQLTSTIKLNVEETRGDGSLFVSFSPTFRQRGSMRLKAGRQILTLVNQFERPMVARVERTIPRDDIVTAQAASRLVLFQTLFPDEVVSREKLSSYSTSTLLAIEFAGRELLLDESQELDLLEASEEQYRNVIRMTEQAGGEIVRKRDDSLMASFESIDDALCVAQRIFFPEEVPPVSKSSPVTLRGVLHRGATLATTTNGETRLFGRTVTLTLKMLRELSESGLVVSAEMLEESVVQQWLDRTDLQDLVVDRSADPKPNSPQLIRPRSPVSTLSSQPPHHNPGTLP